MQRLLKSSVSDYDSFQNQSTRRTSDLFAEVSYKSDTRTVLDPYQQLC